MKSTSEDRMRKQMTAWAIGDDIACEKTPFFISKDKKTGKEVIKAMPMAYIIHLGDHILRSLDLLNEEVPVFLSILIILFLCTVITRIFLFLNFDYHHKT